MKTELTEFEQKETLARKDLTESFMQRTIQIAQQNPLAPFGAIIVYDNQDILYEAVNSAHHHPLAHGELSVLHALFEGGFHGDKNLLSLYTTAEPCPMCASAIYWSRIPSVFYGTSIPFLHDLFDHQIQIRASEIFSNTPPHYQCHLQGGILESQCDQLFVDAKRLQGR
jgi:tRNA(adenine34) deaminase